MGLTIHYQLTLKNATITEAREKILALRNIALKLPFALIDELVELKEDECLDESADDPYAFLKIRASKIIEVDEDTYSSEDATYIISFDTVPGEGSEVAIFGLATYSEVKDINDWSWSSFCKTQYASNPEYGGLENFLKCHLTIVKLLDAACELGITIQVTDEGGYWEKRDIEAFVTVLRKYNGLVAAFTGEMRDKLADAGLSSQSPIFNYPNFEYLEAEGKHPKNL